ncbi:MAG: rhodanese-like domain-containing protein [Saprospiraceae bacterium]|nr:rhodanese-like domain-containing protein [Saprospiraceae bacterium]MBP7679703.1 rhodanese-like domain-containing protein [Saprospiraceae bacterium]
MDITVQELKQKLDNHENFIFIDVREPHEYDEFNLGAKLIPLGDMMTSVSAYDNHKDDEIIVHCRSGRRSQMAQEIFRMYGFSNVRNLEGGVLAWQETFGK